MLERLRRKFIVIVMALVGTVLIAVLGTTFFATYQAQNAAITGSLQRNLYARMDYQPTLGNMPPSDNGRFGNLLGLVVEVSSDGVVLESNDAPVIVEVDALDTVIERVLVKGQASGKDKQAHIAWSSIQDDDGWRIALVDTSTSDALLRRQAIVDLLIVVLALAVLFAITWWLSSWALRPVEQAWEQQRRFVSDASHELKTPLAVILANTQILQHQEGLDDDVMHWIDSTAEEAEHMKSLVGDLLQLARADETAAGVSANAMRHEDIDLSELVESAALEFDAVAFERGCSLETTIDEDIHLQGDPDWIERLVRILIDNACKYGMPGTEVGVSLAKSGNHAVLAVHNHGNPIDPEDLPHVFERFYRSDKARSRESEGGFGLGLAIAKGIVDAHGGALTVTSSEAAGTTFTATL